MGPKRTGNGQGQESEWGSGPSADSHIASQKQTPHPGLGISNDFKLLEVGQVSRQDSDDIPDSENKEGCSYPRPFKKYSLKLGVWLSVRAFT